MLEELRKTIYNNIEKLRKGKGLTQQELANRSGFTLSSYTKNKNKNALTFDNLVLISKGLGTKLTEILKTDNEESPVDILEKLQNDINKTIDDKKEAIAKR